jgi:hypothetical protein
MAFSQLLDNPLSSCKDGPCSDFFHRGFKDFGSVDIIGRLERCGTITTEFLDARITSAAFRAFDSHCCPSITAEKRISRNKIGVNRKSRPGAFSV